MIALQRKLCADCGQPNLNTEPNCWACGGVRFAPSSAKLAGEPTIYLGDVSEQTLSWSSVRPIIVPAWAYPAGAGILAFVTLGAGYWIGRATATARAQPVPSGIVQPVRPLALPAPTPPSSLGSNSYSGSEPQSYQPYLGPTDPTIVTVRSKPGQNLHPASATQPAAPAIQAPAAQPPVSTGPLVYMPQPFPAPMVMPQPVRAPVRSGGSPQIASQVQPSRGSSSPSSRAGSRSQEPDAQPSPPAATRTTALVAMRNDSSATVEVALDGNGSRTARIAPGGVVPLNLSPGSYQLTASGRGLASAQSTLALAPQKSYTLLVVSRKGDDGKEGLFLIEPAIDGQ